MSFFESIEIVKDTYLVSKSSYDPWRDYEKKAYREENISQKMAKKRRFLIIDSCRTF